MTGWSKHLACRHQSQTFRNFVFLLVMSKLKRINLMYMASNGTLQKTCYIVISYNFTWKLIKSYSSYCSKQNMYGNFNIAVTGKCYSIYCVTLIPNPLCIFPKKIIRIITNIRPRDSCSEVFKSIQIMTLYSQYIYSLVSYTINNKHPFDANKEIHK